MVRDVLVVIGIGGMGAEIARRMGSGRKVFLADRDQDALFAAAASSSDEGFCVVSHVVDVTDASTVLDVANAAADRGSVVAVAHTAAVSPAPASGATPSVSTWCSPHTDRTHSVR